MTSSNYHPRYRPDIDGLRALAILPVIAFHAFPEYVPGGFVGVDIFFVISGYLISLIIFKNLEAKAFRFTEFYARRILRLFPALISVLSATYAVGWFVLLPDEFKMLGKHIAAGLGFIQNIVLKHEAGYFDTASELKPLLHLWSLGIEEQFYFLFPLLAWLFWRVGLNFLTGVLIISLTSFIWAKNGIHIDAVKTFYFVHTRFWELMSGAILAYFHSVAHWPQWATHWMHRAVFNRLVFRHVPPVKRQDAILASTLSVLGLLLICYVIFTLDAQQLQPGSRAPALGGALLLILAGPTAWVNRKLLTWRPMVALGLISYPLYLWHWPILSFLRITEEETLPHIWRITAVLLSVALAALTYWLIEKPIRYGDDRRAKVSTLCVLAVLLGFIGFNTYLQDGLPFRGKETIRHYSAVFDAKNAPINPENQDARCKEKIQPGYVYCRQSRDGVPGIVLLGDSHSVSLFPGLEALLAKRGMDVLLETGRGRCLPFRDVLSYDKSESAEDRKLCPPMVKATLDYIGRQTEVHTVILVSRGPLYLTGKGFYESDLAVEKTYNHELRLVERPELTDHTLVWKTAMRRTLDELLAHGKRVIFVLDHAELGFDVKTCVDIRPWRLLPKPPRTPCAISRAVFEERNRAYRDLMLYVLKDYPKVMLFDAAAQLCDEHWCWATKNEELLYFDDDHLSAAGARTVAEALLPLLTRH